MRYTEEYYKCEICQESTRVNDKGRRDPPVGVIKLSMDYDGARQDTAKDYKDICEGCHVKVRDFIEKAIKEGKG